jgi:hypothetical protein
MSLAILFATGLDVFCAPPNTVDLPSGTARIRLKPH